MLQEIIMTLHTSLTIAARNPISGVSLTMNENSLLAPSILAIPLNEKCFIKFILKYKIVHKIEHEVQSGQTLW